MPPQLAESILTSLGATGEYRDAVLGDLAEEFAMRSDRDGERSARAWYYREAVRTTPHLLGNAVRTMRGRDARRLAGIVVTAYVLVATVFAFGFAMLTSFVGAVWPEHRALLFAGPPALAVTITMLALSCTAGGYIAAWLDNGSPLLSAMALGVTWAVVDAVALMVPRVGATSAWFDVSAPFIVLTCAIGGGLIQARSRGRPSLPETVA